MYNNPVEHDMCIWKECPININKHLLWIQKLYLYHFRHSRTFRPQWPNFLLAILWPAYTCKNLAKRRQQYKIILPSLPLLNIIFN